MRRTTSAAIAGQAVPALATPGVFGTACRTCRGSSGPMSKSGDVVYDV
jgi:hypothetical protein